MAIRATGLKINDKELKKAVDNIVAKSVNRYISAGDKAQKEIRRKYTRNWFFNESDTMVDCLEFEHKLTQGDGKAIIYFTSYINMEKFSAATRANDSSIYEWADRYHVGINPAQYLLDLQWNQGIHGLPKEWSRPNYRFGQSWNDDQQYWYNPYYSQGMSMSNYVKFGFIREWKSTVNKCLKK